MYISKEFLTRIFWCMVYLFFVLLILYPSLEKWYSLRESELLIRPDEKVSQYKENTDVSGIIEESTTDVSPTIPSNIQTVCINTATAQELSDALPGIGIKKAEAIVEYRELIGGFDSIDELLEVDGIGEKLLETIKPYCTVE